MKFKSKISRKRYKARKRFFRLRRYTNCQCDWCGKHFQDVAPVYCCDGYMCGCYGRPVEPQICSEFCAERLFSRPYPKKQIALNLIDLSISENLKKIIDLQKFCNEKFRKYMLDQIMIPNL